MLIFKTTSTSPSWQKAVYSPFLRKIQVFSFVSKFLFFLWWDKFTGNNTSSFRHRRAKWLVKNLLVLGPTFIKIGQALSTRPDLIPTEYIQELGELQDRVPPFDSKLAIAIVESELGQPIESLFADFDPCTLASASLGQVHLAKLPNGHEVVVKVQRPGLKKMFDLDFQVLRQLVNFSDNFLPWTKKYELKAIYVEFFDILYQEIDYILEGKNAERFGENFKGYPKIKVPRVYWEYSREKVLTLEYLPGIKVNDLKAIQASGLNPNRIISLGICAYLKQLLEDGFFQSDPHPGNMAVSQNGSLIFYDFGTMAEVKSLNKDQMVKTFFAVLKKDTDQVMEGLIYMGLITPVADMTPVKRLVSFLLDRFREKPVDFRAFEEISTELYVMFEQQPFRLPPQMTFILKSLTTLDGIARALNPEYNLLAASQPFVKNLVISQNKGNLLGSLARQAQEFVKNQISKPTPGEILFDRLESRIETGELQLRVRNLESERQLKKIFLGIKTLTYACLTGFTLLSSAVLVGGPYATWAFVSFSFSGLCFLFLVRSWVTLRFFEKLDK